MKRALASALSVCAASAIACGCEFMLGQSSGVTPTASSGQQLVKVVLKHFTISEVTDPNTHQPLRTDGSWSLSKKRPEICPEGARDCVEVHYAVPDQSAECAWTIAMDESGTDGTVLDENDDADKYLIRKLSDSEAVALIQSRTKPVTPPISVALGANGTVITRVLVGKSGDVQKVSFVSGPQILVPASIDAAKKWTFKPLKISTRSVQYELQVAFTFYPPIQTMPGAVKMKP